MIDRSFALWMLVSVTAFVVVVAVAQVAFGTPASTTALLVAVGVGLDTALNPVLERLQERETA